MRTFVRSLPVAMLALMGPVGVAAGTDASRVAALVPVEVSEVVTVGTWVNQQASGTYRTVTVQTYTPVESVDVVLHWVGSRSPAEPLQIIASRPLREFNDLKLATASVTIDVEGESSIRITVIGRTAEDEPAPPKVFLATQPGQYEELQPAGAAPR